jgi:membrane-associated phospholipid phosphatase
VDKFFKKITPRLQKRLVIATVLFWVPVLIFIELAEDILDKDPILLDTSLLNFIRSLSSDGLTTLFKFVTHGGDTVFILSATVLLAVYLYLKKRPRDMMAVLFSVGGAGIINLLLKLFFQRSRPDIELALITENSFSFPSGHAMGSAALGLVVAIMFLRSKYRWPALLLSGTYIFVIGVSRVYLGVHYPSDIIAGWCISLAWVLVVYIALEHPAFVKRTFGRMKLKKES